MQQQAAPTIEVNPLLDAVRDRFRLYADCALMLRVRVGFILLAVVLAFGWMTTMAMSDEHSLTVNVVTKKSKASLSAAHLLWKSSQGYLMGNAYQDFSGLYVTDPVVPPEGINLKANLVTWEELRNVEFTDWCCRVDSNVTKAKLTLTGGSVREVFVWIPGTNETFSPAIPESLQITGKLVLQGKERDVTILGNGVGNGDRDMIVRRIERNYSGS
jgi:hypothetical protein